MERADMKTEKSIVKMFGLFVMFALMAFVVLACDSGCDPTPPDTSVAALSAGSYHTLALGEDGTVWAWGDNVSGQLGDGTNVDQSLPTLIGTDMEWAAVAAKSDYTVALQTDGTLWTWGAGLGDGTNESQNTPIQIGEDTDWSALAAGRGHAMVLKTDGTLWGWGLNSFGQLGDGTYDPGNAPIQIGVDTDWAAASAGGSHTVALKTDGTLWAWGENFSGQLGNGTFNKGNNTPVQVGTDTDWVEVATGNYHTLALKADGSLWAWGSNLYGQLGDGTFTKENDKSTPIQIGTDIDWAVVATGENHSVALKIDGTLWAWGDNWGGALGDGTTEDRYVPTQIGTDTDWVMAAAGKSHTVALKSDGTVWAWGLNGLGQLGDGTTEMKSLPALIGSAGDWVGE